MAIPYKFNQDVLDHYLASDDELMRELAQDTVANFDKYIEAVATHQEVLDSYKSTYDGSDFREMAMKLDASRKSKHDACLTNINALQRGAAMDGMQFCMPQGTKPFDQATRTDLGMAIMELHAQKELSDLTPEMKDDLGEDLPQPKSQTIELNQTTENKPKDFKRWENKPLEAPKLSDYPYRVWRKPIRSHPDHDPANPNVRHTWANPRGPKRGASSERRTPGLHFSRAQLGDVVSTRVRFAGYEDEPYDVVHAGQEFGYVNSKYRPCMILGMNDDNVVLAPMYTASNATPQMEMEYGGIELTDEETEAANLNHNGGTILSCANVFQVPKSEFTYSSFMGSLPMSTVKDYTMTFVKYNTEAKEHPHRMQAGFDRQRPEGLNWLSNMTMTDSVKSKSISHSSRIHPDDPDRKASEYRNWVSAYKYEKNKLMEGEESYYSKTKIKEINDKLKSARAGAAVAREMSFKYMVNDINSFKHEMHLHNQALQHGRYGANTNWERTDHPSTYEDKFQDTLLHMQGGHVSDPYVPARKKEPVVESDNSASQTTAKSDTPDKESDIPF